MSATRAIRASPRSYRDRFLDRRAERRWTETRSGDGWARDRAHFNTSGGGLFNFESHRDDPLALLMYRLRYPLINALDRRVRVFTRVTIVDTYARIYMRDEDNGRTIVCRYECAGYDTCGMYSHTRERATRENTIKAAPGKNTNLNGTKEICSHIRCIRMNGARLLQFTIYCFATFFSADASGIRSLLPVFSLPPPPALSSLLRVRALSRSRVTGYEAEETKR